MIITCPKCVNGIADGITCIYCEGDSEIDLLDARFKELAESDFRALTGQVWNEMLDRLGDIMDKCNDIKEKVDEIKEVVDEL